MCNYVGSLQSRVVANLFCFGSSMGICSAAYPVSRREFIILLCGAAGTGPLAARAQQPGKLQTIGFLGPSTASFAGEWLAAFVQRLRELGWIAGRNIAIESRWGEG